MSPPSVPLLPLPNVVKTIFLKKSELVSLARAHAFLQSLPFLKAEAQRLDVSLSGAFIAIQSGSAAAVVRRLCPSEDAARTEGARVLTEGGAGDAAEEHPLKAVLEDEPTEQQWKEACAEFARRIMQGQLGHIFMREIKATSERFARLQRCADVLAAYAGLYQTAESAVAAEGSMALPGVARLGPGGSQEADLDVRLYDGLRYALCAPAMHEGIWSRWCTELRKFVWGLESAQLVASHGCLHPPAQQLPEQQPLEQHPPLKEAQQTQEQWAQEQRAQEQRAQEQRAQEQRGQEQRGQEQRAQEQRAQEQRGQEQRAPEQRAQEQRAQEQRAQEQRAQEQRAQEQRAQEQRAQDQQHLPQWTPVQLLPSSHQAPLVPTLANGGGRAHGPAGGGARGSCQTRCDGGDGVATAVAAVEVGWATAAKGDAPLSGGDGATPPAVPAGLWPAGACGGPGADPASDCDAGGLSSAVQGEERGVGSPAACVLPPPSPPISPVWGAEAVQDTGPTAACDEWPQREADDAFLRRCHHSGLISRSRSPPRPPSPPFPPSPRRRQWPVTGEDAEGSSQRTPSQPRPWARYRSRSPSPSRSCLGSWPRSRSPRRLEHGSRPRSGCRSPSPRPSGPYGRGDGGSGSVTLRGGHSGGGGLLRVSDRPWRPAGDPQTWTPKEWSEAVLRFLQSQPGGTAEVIQLRRVGLEIPAHLLDQSGKRPSGYLYNFPDLWTVSDRSTATRGMSLTALPQAPLPGAEARSDGGDASSGGRQQQQQQEQQERRRWRDREERERETEDERERERASGPGRKREQRERESSGRRGGDRSASRERKREEEGERDRARGRADGSDIPLEGMSGLEAAYVKRLVRLLRAKPKGVPISELRRLNMDVPLEVLDGRNATRWFKRHRHLWDLSEEKPAVLQLKNQYMPPPAGEGPAPPAGGI